MSDIDEYLQGRKLQEAEEALNEAKKRLEEEKNRLKEEQKRAKLKEKEASRHVAKPEETSSDEDYREERVSRPGLQPWMLWNLIILVLVLVLFGVSMFYPKNGVDSEKVGSIVDEKTATLKSSLEKQIDDVESSLTAKIADKKDKVAAAQALETIEITGGPRFMLNAEDEGGITIGNKGSVDVINGTSSKYVLIVEDKEKENIRCDADRYINDEVKKDAFKNLKVEPANPEHIPLQVIKDKDTMKIKYDFECHYEEDTSDSPETTKQTIEFTFNFK